MSVEGRELMVIILSDVSRVMTSTGFTSTLSRTNTDERRAMQRIYIVYSEVANA